MIWDGFLEKIGDIGFKKMDFGPNMEDGGKKFGMD